jgi:N-acetyl sugar amidotransferase
MIETKYQQCKRCVMDTSDMEILFDTNGFCNHCVEYFEKTSHKIYHGESSDKQLSEFVRKIKKAGKNKKYDCVVGVSGGVDSSYVAYLAIQLGLKPLAVHLDNGWNSELSVHNIEKVLNKLNIDLYTYVLDWEEFRDLQLSFLKASVPEIDTPTDMAIPAVLHKVAAKYNVKYILSGCNYATEGVLPESWHYDRKDETYLRAIHKQFGKMKLTTFPTFGFINETYYKFIKGIRFVYILNYIPYSKGAARKLLEKEYDWTYYGGKHYESRYTRFVQSFILSEKFNIDYRKANSSTLICTGEITREEAIQELASKPYETKQVEEDKEYFCKKLGISFNEFDEMMEAPLKSYRDYPNNKKLLEFLYGVYRKLF